MCCLSFKMKIQTGMTWNGSLIIHNHICAHQCAGVFMAGMRMLIVSNIQYYMISPFRAEWTLTNRSCSSPSAETSLFRSWKKCSAEPSLQTTWLRFLPMSGSRWTVRWALDSKVQGGCSCMAFYNCLSLVWTSGNKWIFCNSWFLPPLPKSSSINRLLFKNMIHGNTTT